MKRIRFRRRWMGQRHGVARGVGVYGSPGFDTPDRLDDLLSRCVPLRQWSNEHGLVLDDGPDSLAALDQRLDAWSADESHHGTVDLPNEVGIYLGTVIVKHVDGSHWRVWPNGHPVVRLRSSRELDVTVMANERFNRTGPGLYAIYSMSQSW